MERTLVLIPAASAIMEAHLTVDDVAAMVDGRVPASRRAHMEAHLAICAECRAELAESSAIVGSVPSSSRVPMRWASLAAAAAVLIVVVPLLRIANTRPPLSNERADTGGVSNVTVLAPAGDVIVAHDSLQFIWHAVPGAATYRLVVSDSAGAPVLTRTTTDTTITPGSGARLAGDARYFWYVDALRADASSITSAQVGFSIRAR